MPRNKTFETNLFGPKTNRQRRPSDILLRNAYASKSRAQLVIRCLGFRSFWQLGEVAGVNHVTVANLLYKPSNQSNYGRSFHLVFSALRDGFDRNRKRMMAEERSFVKAFLRHWAKTTIMDGIAREKIGRQKDASELDKKTLNQRYRRQQLKLKRQLEEIERAF
jgi:hypothetical protein